MKIIHCSDIHLDSPLNSNLSYEKAKVRRREILLSFLSLVDYAVENEVRAVIISGDLFDSNIISSETEKTLFEKISSAENIDFLYLKGNHDLDVKFKTELPKNFKIFQDEFSTFLYDNVCIGGVPIQAENYNNVDFDNQNYNILVMHGNTDNAADEYYVNLKELKNKNIDYLALGHIHKFSQGKIDKRGVFVQSGCLDGRGFDECGQKGFVLIDTDKKSFDFIPFSSRLIEEITVDISSATSTLQIISLIEKATENITAENIVRVVLCGKIKQDVIKDVLLIKSRFDKKLFSFSLKDNSNYIYNYEDFKNDISLKGEFIRNALKSEMSETERDKVISTVLCALNSEDLPL